MQTAESRICKASASRILSVLYGYFRLYFLFFFIEPANRKKAIYSHAHEFGIRFLCVCLLSFWREQTSSSRNYSPSRNSRTYNRPKVFIRNNTIDVPRVTSVFFFPSPSLGSVNNAVIIFLKIIRAVRCQQKCECPACAEYSRRR